MRFNKNWFKVLSVAIAIAFCITLFPANVSAQPADFSGISKTLIGLEKG